MKHSQKLFPKKVLSSVLFCSLIFISSESSVLAQVPKKTAMMLSRIEQKPETEEEKLQNTILWINHMNLLVTKILTYNDRLVLSLEYEKLMDSTNFSNLPEGKLKISILKLIDTLKRLDDSWAEKERVKELFKKNMDAAFRKSMRQAGRIWVNAGSVANMVAVSFDYYDTKDLLRAQFDEKSFEIAKGERELIQDLRTRMWEAFSEEFANSGVQDQERISVKDCRELMSILKNNSLQEQYVILSGSNNQKRFIKFPFYWYQLGYAAYSQGKLQESAKAFDHFQSVYRSLIRNDELFVNYLIAKTQLIEKLTPHDKRQLLETLATLEGVILNQDWKTRYYIAVVHAKLNNFQKAESLILHNIAFLTSQIKENSASKYRDILGEKNIPLIECPNNESLAYNRTFLTEIKLKKGDSADNCMKDILRQFAVSAHEKLSYLGMVFNERLFKSLRKDIKGIYGKSVHNEFEPYFSISIPAVWFYAEDTPNIALTCFDANGNMVRRLDKFTGEWDKKNRQMVLTIPFDAEYALFETIYKVKLEIEHKIYPVTISYQITHPQKVDIGKVSSFKKIKNWTYQKLKIQQTETVFIPQSATFQNKDYSLNEE